MAGKLWKKILFIILVIACLFDITLKLVQRNSFKNELQASAQYVQDLVTNNAVEENSTETTNTVEVNAENSSNVVSENETTENTTTNTLTIIPLNTTNN